MGKKLNLINQKFGKLLVIDFSDIKVNGKCSFVCLCDCGNTKTVPATYLKHNIVKSCGCLQKENAKKIGKNNRKDILPVDGLFIAYKVRAKAKKLEFNLDIITFSALTSCLCFYCNAAPSQKFKPNSRSKERSAELTYTYNGLDRIDGNKGYIIGNVLACCKVCNYAKHTMNTHEFLKHITKIYNNCRI